MTVHISVSTAADDVLSLGKKFTYIILLSLLSLLPNEDGNKYQL